MIEDCKKTDISILKTRTRAIEAGPAATRPQILSFGIAPLDAALPDGGLGAGLLHEVSGAAGDAAARGFVAALAGRFAGARGEAPVLWCRLRGAGQEDGALYGPGLVRFGLRPDRLLLVLAERPAELLWAMEEGLRCRHLAAVIGEGVASGLSASRRLQLAAGTSGVAAFLLPPPGGRASASAAATRWHVVAMPGRAVPCWRVELRRARGGGRPGDWIVEWEDAAFRFRLAAPLADRSLVPAASR
ncbi:MAG: hypothetical protein KIT81_03360 [Alphaproteobacteria bacterium]|nr:hypothetical protein [Alphaproteobacteria bacterium]